MTSPVSAVAVSRYASQPGWGPIDPPPLATPRLMRLKFGVANTVDAAVDAATAAAAALNNREGFGNLRFRCSPICPASQNS